ncbi:winged helix-turn-helix domain-containing protein [Alphaproteobacteria bacterium]|nr:winged helix-turn-helix domain-containing protein [Alphaproteobacteria bacterium]
MEEKFILLIYEKELKLNQILQEQISRLNIYEVYGVTDEKKLLELLEQMNTSILVLNLNKLNESLKNIILNHKFYNRINKILGYYNKNNYQLDINKEEITALEKPFKIVHLVDELEKLSNLKIQEYPTTLLMEHLKFLPYEKVLINLKTKNKEHLTEKENKLLYYLYSNKNSEIKKNDLLNEIWGVSESLNTHTLETHLYRLRRKLYKAAPELSFLLSNGNGSYTLKFKLMSK